MNSYKEGFFFSTDFIANNSWNGYEYNCLFANVGGGQFVDIARPVGTDAIQDSRGVAIGDFNGDGRLDLAINNQTKAPTIYINNLVDSGNWMGIRLAGIKSNRDAIGARVRLTVGGKTMTRQIKAGAGYASQAMMAAHFGLGDADRIDALEITWPTGEIQRFESPTLAGLINQTVTIEEGTDGLIAQR